MPKRYTLEQALPEVKRILSAKGLCVAENSVVDSGYHITADNGQKKARIRIRHLQYDESYQNSLLPYSVYKIKAFPNGKHDNHTLRDVDFVVGYNPSEDSIACVPVHAFRSQGSISIHQKEGTRHEYYNKWVELDTFLLSKSEEDNHTSVPDQTNRKAIKVLPTTTIQKMKSREGYDPDTGSDYDFHRDVMEEDNSLERLLIMLRHGTSSDKDKKELIQRFRVNYPQVDGWLKQRAKDKPNDEWSKRFDI
jgi:hypothetical protein